MDSEENATSCPVCRDIYSDPRCLTCGHSFCLKCLKVLAGNKQKFPCPICRFGVDLRHTNVDQLPKNFVLCNVIEAKDKKQPSLCSAHNKSLDLFCRRCDVVICSKCLTMRHKGHAIEDIDTIFSERNQQYGVFLESTKHLSLMIEEKRNAVKQSRISMENNIESISKTVKNTFKKWNDALQKQSDAIFSYLHQERDRKRQVFSKAERIVEGSMSTVTELDIEIRELRTKGISFAIQQYSFITERQEYTECKILQDIQACFTPPDTLVLEVYAPWIEEAINNIKPIDMADTQARPGRDKIAEIQEENFILKRECEKLRNTLQELETRKTKEVEHLEGLNHCLERLVQRIHDHVVSGVNDLPRTLAQPAGIKPESSIAKMYNYAQEICAQFTKVETEFRESKTKWENDFKANDTIHTKETEHLQLTMKFLNEENDNLLTSLEKEKHRSKTTQSKCNKLREKMEELEQSLCKEKEDKNTLQNKYTEKEQDIQRKYNESETEWNKYCDELIKSHTNEKEQLHKAITNLTVEKDNLLTRLSTIAADRLTHENVNIVDLSDVDCPTKLQKVYSELYDNEWTDAFEELTRDGNATENEAIMILLKILVSSFHNCREITWGRYERLKHVASYIEQEISLQSPKVMSNVSEEGLTTQEAASSKGQLEKNEESVDQTSDPVKNVDNIEERPEAIKHGENKGMHVNDAEDNVESSDPILSEASSKDKSDNTKGKNGAAENMEPGDPYNSGEEKVDSGHPDLIGTSKDKSENNGAEENMRDTNMILKLKDKAENKTGKHLECTIYLNFKLKHDLKVIWRKTAVALKGVATESLCSLIETCLDMPFCILPMTSKYLKRCIDLCWRMGVQEKPLHLDGVAKMDSYVGKKFDKDKFRCYTRSGSHVAFVVWPTLYLYEAGPILMKGIAQGCSPSEANDEKP